MRGAINQARCACRVTLAGLTVALALLAAPSPASAQGGAGVRAGVSADPDQFYFGGHFDTGLLVERLSFRPNAELGVGDDRTTVAVNLEFAYWFPLPRQPWSIYAGAGPALNVFRLHDHEGDRTDVEPGFNALVGLSHRRGLFFELKLGFIDSPEVKFGVGYTWR